MLQPRDIIEKRLNAETHRLVGELLLQQFGKFLDKHHSDLSDISEGLVNTYDINTEPILLDSKKTENITLLDTLYSNNKLLSRILISLAAICEEINLLIEESKNYYNIFLIYEEENNKDTALKSIASLTEELQKIYCFVERCSQVINLLFNQLCCILGKEPNSNEVCFSELLDLLGSLLICLLTFDYVLCLPTFREHWFLYRRSIKNILHNPSKYQFTRDQLRSLDKHLFNLESALLSGNIYKDTIEKCLINRSVINLKSNSLSNEINTFICRLLTNLEKDEENVLFTQMWLKVNCLIVLEYYLFGITDRKVIKRIVELNKKSSACVLVGDILWYPEEFLLKHAKTLTKFIDIKNCDNIRMMKISQKNQNLLKDTNNLAIQAVLWMIEINRLTKINMFKLDGNCLQEITDLLIQGLKLMKKINETVKWTTNLHADKELPMSKSVCLGLCRLIELLKCFELYFHKKLLPLIYVILLISQQLSHKALILLNNIKKSYTQEKSYKEQQLDILSSLNVCEQNLKATTTKQRILIAKLSLSATGINTDNLTELRSTLNRLEMICSTQYLLKEIGDCSFLYWHQSYILPIYFKSFLNCQIGFTRYYLMLNAINDCVSIGGDEFPKICYNNLNQNLLSPINQMIETNLRLQTHLHLQLTVADPFKKANCFNLSKLKPTLLFNSYINIKKEIEHYLSQMFYNLTTVVLHDWKTYGEMRQLAYLQYNLETVDDHLPMQTLEQGLDVLEIMRNINTFVGKYLYNLNNQIFVEESSTSKSLNTINISHVANSIRTHGIGIMSTTVNVTYQLLQKKFFIFSQFLFDEHIKSRLLKDLRYFNENKLNFAQMYPYERAEKFNIAIRNLGLNEKGLSYLDLFRKLITQIGNAIGYVRLIRSGGRRCLADGTCYLPDFKDVDKLNKLIITEEIPVVLKEAIDGLTIDLKNLVDNFEEATEYFKLLVNVFIPVFRNPNNIHLKNFYIIVPPLSINFVEHSLTCKERLNKKNKNDATFTDDGFAIGLAYIIELLEQEKPLNSLHWFHSIQAKFARDKKKVYEQRSLTNKHDDKLQQTLTLSEKRINLYEKEFQLLYFNFNSAKVFFQS